ncbi:MAG: dihydrodipicolinate synthase family protein, partial [Rhizobiales bacterium 12-66-7]
PVNVLTTHSSWLMASLTMGCNGLLSGAGSVIPDLQVALWRAVQDDNLALAQQINDRIYPLAQAFYAPPFLDMHNRMKECLVMLGRQERAVVRAPLMKLPQAELDRLRRALTEAGVTRDGALDRAA